jgi:hypothetical protein
MIAEMKLSRSAELFPSTAVSGRLALLLKTTSAVKRKNVVSEFDIAGCNHSWRTLWAVGRIDVVDE